MNLQIAPDLTESAPLPEAVLELQKVAENNGILNLLFMRESLEHIR